MIASILLPNVNRNIVPVLVPVHPLYYERFLFSENFGAAGYDFHYQKMAVDKCSSLNELTIESSK